jgi:hypothetical protein
LPKYPQAQACSHAYLSNDADGKQSRRSRRKMAVEKLSSEAGDKISLDETPLAGDGNGVLDCYSPQIDYV